MRGGVAGWLAGWQLPREVRALHLDVSRGCHPPHPRDTRWAEGKGGALHSALRTCVPASLGRQAGRSGTGRSSAPVSAATADGNSRDSIRTAAVYIYGVRIMHALHIYIRRTHYGTGLHELPSADVKAPLAAAAAAAAAAHECHRGGMRCLRPASFPRRCARPYPRCALSHTYVRT